MSLLKESFEGPPLVRSKLVVTRSCDASNRYKLQLEFETHGKPFALLAWLTLSDEDHPLTLLDGYMFHANSGELQAANVDATPAEPGVNRGRFGKALYEE